jgi:ubiquinol oxidase
MHKAQHEELVRRLQDPTELAQYAAKCADFKPGLVARLLGSILVGAGNLVYGTKPSYEKFKAVEVIARIPYQSWEAVAYTYLTAFYGDEMHAIKLSKVLPFARHAQDNETMHVVLMSQLVKKYHRNKFIRHTLIPLVFSFFYYWAIWLLSMLDKRIAFELNFLFESHAYDQYTMFIEVEGERMKTAPIESAFLTYYGREAANEYDLFQSIRIDEIIHRNQSVQLVHDLDHHSVS